MLLLVCCGVAAVGAFVIRDLLAANAEAQKMYSASVPRLQQIGELQNDAQETQRAALYALATSNRSQVEYSNESRDTGKRVTNEIGEYAKQAREPAEVALVQRLARDWSEFLSVRDKVLTLSLKGSSKEAVGLDHSGDVPSFERVRQDLNRVKSLYDEDASQRLANLMASSRRSTWRMVGILSFLLLFACAAIWAIQKSRMRSAIQLAKLQMEFVASASHELRTPLAILHSAADNIADGLVEDKAALQKYGAILQKQSRRMGELIEQILLFVSTGDGSHRYVLQPLDLSPIIDAAVAGFDSQAKARNIVIARQIEPDLPLAMADASGIVQCVQNLIGNAIKYSGESRIIVLRAFTAPIGNGPQTEACISVIDHGIGIDSSELTHIFDPFYRSTRVQGAEIPGTGLGLSLAKRIAESMGGSLSVVSEISSGSTFTLHLRIARMEDALTRLPRPSPSSLSRP